MSRLDHKICPSDMMDITSYKAKTEILSFIHHRILDEHRPFLIALHRSNR